jgi:hypothetical protein
MRSKSEGLGVRVNQKNAPVVNHRRDAGPSKGGVNRVGATFTAIVWYLGGVIKD